MTLKHSLTSIVALLLLVAGVSRAGNNSWTLTGPEGGFVSAVAVHPTDASVVLAGAGNGMYRSTDGGVTWIRVGDGASFSDILFDPLNSNRVFAVAKSNALHRSEDGGQTFAVLPWPAGTRPHYLAISGNSTMYALDGDARVFRSSDAGATWIQTGSNWPGTTELTAIAVDRTQSSVVYVGARGVGIFKSTDSGANWSGPLAGSPGPADNQIYQIVIKPDDSDRIVAAASDGAYVSVNGGTSWSTATLGTRWQSIAFDPVANNNVLAVSYLGQMHRSSDGGLTWPLAQQGPALRVGESPRLLFAPANKVIVATSDGPMISTDGGATFTLRVSGIRAQGIYSFSSADDGVMYGAFYFGPFGIYKYHGVDWQPVDNAELKSRLSVPATLFVTAAPSNSLRLFVIGGSFTELVSSVDGGQSWSSPHPQFNSGSTYLRQVVVDPINDQVVYVLTTNSGVWKSINGGSTYTQATTGLPAALNSLVVDRANPQVLYAGGYFTGTTGVFKSTNGGASWAATGVLPDELVYNIVLDPTDSTVVYARLNTGIYKSTNGGNTWAPLNLNSTVFGIAGGPVFDREVPTTMFVAGISEGAGFSRSVDGGLTWQSARWDVLPSLGSLNAFSLNSVFPNVVFGGGLSTGLYEYQVSNDLRLSTASPLTLALGSPGSLTIPMENLGPFHAAAPQIRVVVPSNLTITVPAGCTYTAPNLRCVLAALRSGETRNFVLPYTASATAANGGVSVHLVGRELDLVDTNNGIGISVSVRELADLGVTTAGTAAVQRDAGVTYTATVANNGPNASAVTTLVVQVPAGITVQTSTPSAGTCTATGASRTCELGVLASGASATVTVQGTATVVGGQAWLSTVSSTSAQDSVAGNNTAAFTTTVTAPPPTGGGSSSGGGGGRFDWLVLAVLGGVLLSKSRLRVSARR